VELEVYSYSSYDGDNHNLLKYLYGKDNKNIKSIGAYYYGHQNYDHAAIEVAGKLFKKNTTHEKKVMIVISDGNPCGNGYGGSLAKQAVQKEVRKLEQEGMFVMQIAITDHVDSNEMFKHWLKFTDMPNLTNKLRTVITGMIRAAT
jgi:nitric oxide reductase activation protein